VTGDTFAVKEILKSFSGRWVPEQRGWTLDGVDPEALKAALRSSKDVARIKDEGPVELQISHDPQSLIVGGQTYPVRTLLASEGGVWDAALGGWRFPRNSEGAADKLAQRLQHSGRVGCIIQQLRQSSSKQGGNDALLSTKSIAATTPDQSRDKVVGVIDQGVEKGSSQKHRRSDIGALVFAGSKNEGVKEHAVTEAGPTATPRAAQGAAANAPKRQACKVMPVVPTQGRKVAEITKWEQRLCVSPGGSRKHTTTEHCLRRISGKQRPRGNNGSEKLQQDLQSVAVTKRKKIVETKDKVIETATITIKRARNKNTS